MRAYLIEKLYDISKKPYQLLFKRDKPWGLKANELLSYPEGSLGFELGKFLTHNHFEMQPQLENHDVFHTITAIETTVPDETALQYYLLGNGKRSIYQFTMICITTLFYPECLSRFINEYKRGKSAQPFHHLDFYPLLKTPLDEFRMRYNISLTNNSCISNTECLAQNFNDAKN